MLADLLVWNGTGWKYVKGPKTTDSVGSYPSQLGTGDINSYPGARQYAMMWLDSNNDVWLFGGLGYGTDSSVGQLNDLWKYTVATNIWTWVSGSNTYNQNGNYTATPRPPAPPKPPVTSTPLTSTPGTSQSPSSAGTPLTPINLSPSVAVPGINSPESYSLDASNNVTLPGSTDMSPEAKIATGVVVPVVVVGVGVPLLLTLLKRCKKKRQAATTTAVPLGSIDGDKYDVIDETQKGTSYSPIDSATTVPTTLAQTELAGDSRLIPYAAVTLDKEIGEGSYGKGTQFSSGL